MRPFYYTLSLNTGSYRIWNVKLKLSSCLPFKETSPHLILHSLEMQTHWISQPWDTRKLRNHFLTKSKKRWSLAEGNQTQTLFLVSGKYLVCSIIIVFKTYLCRYFQKKGHIPDDRKAYTLVYTYQWRVGMQAPYLNRYPNFVLLPRGLSTLWTRLQTAANQEKYPPGRHLLRQYLNTKKYNFKFIKFKSDIKNAFQPKVSEQNLSSILKKILFLW